MVSLRVIAYARNGTSGFRRATSYKPVLSLGSMQATTPDELLVAQLAVSTLKPSPGKSQLSTAIV